MIREIAKEVAEILKAKGCPIPVVVDGPESTKTTTFGRERIVFEHDEGTGDSFAAIKGTYPNPVPKSIRLIGFKVTIYAQAPAAGAQPFEHRRRAEHALDLLVCALIERAAKRKNGMVLKGGKFVQPEDLAKSETIGGAVYELTLTWERGIRDVTWAGEKRPEATIGTDLAIVNGTLVHLKGGVDDDDDPMNIPSNAEIACGA